MSDHPHCDYELIARLNRRGLPVPAIAERVGNSVVPLMARRIVAANMAA